MNGNDMDTFQAMSIFVRVVERGSFTAVARELQTTQPNISKSVQSLERRLGAPLLARSTRQLSLTDEGQRYYEECRRILAAVEFAESSFKSGRETVAGPLRVAAPVSFGRMCVAPLLREFLKRYPEVRIDLHLSDHNQDLHSEGLDVALRIGSLADSNLVARKLGDTQRITVAAPGYLQRAGEPATPESLTKHNCLAFNLLADPTLWRYRKNTRTHDVRIHGNAQSNNSEALREMVLSGLGISLSPDWLFAADIKAGKVQAVLGEYRAESLAVHALMPGNRRQSARAKAFIAYMHEALAPVLAQQQP